MSSSGQNSRLLSDSLRTPWVRTVCCETWTDSSIVHRLEGCLLAKARDLILSSFLASYQIPSVTECICLTSLTRAKCGVPSTLCWKIGKISTSTELFGFNFADNNLKLPNLSIHAFVIIQKSLEVH